MKNQESIVIDAALNIWNKRVVQNNKLLDELTDQQFLREIVPGKNRGVYIIGHLTSVHDQVLPLLDLGERMYAHLDEIFYTAKDKMVKEIPEVSEIKSNFKHINEILSSHFNGLHPDEWFERHNSITEVDFKKEPHRNKLSVLISRTNHFSYHMGQLVFLKK